MPDVIDLGNITSKLPSQNGISGNVLGALVGGGINALINWRNKQFTEKWNNIQMQREDSAVQRRVADLKEAGLNPYLAMTNGGSGAPSGGYSTPQMSSDFINTANDLLSSSQDRKVQQAYTKQMQNLWKNQSEESQFNMQIAKANAEMARNASMLDTIKTGFALGIPSLIHQDGYGNNSAQLDFSNYRNFNLDDNVPFANMFRNDILSNDSYRTIAEQEARKAIIDGNWAKAEKWLNAVGDVSGDVTDIIGAVSGAKKAFNPFQPVTPKIQSKERVYGRHGYIENYQY